HADGPVGTALAANGVATSDFITESDDGLAMSVSPQGKTAVLTSGGGFWDVLVYDASGHLDTTISADGIITGPVSGAYQFRGDSIAYLPDGSLLIGGADISTIDP